MADFDQMVGERIAWARKEADITQETLAAALGFKDRQILSNLESGKRKVSSEELLRCIQVLGKPLEFFTDPGLIVGEGILSWRAGQPSEELKAFEATALGLLGAYRQLIGQLGETSNPLRPMLPLDARSTFEAAAEAGEKLVELWDIAARPAPQLQERIEKDLAVLVVPLDAPAMISGGAVNLPEGAAIFLNRHHPLGRRHFTLAHELFHILTWHSMPPERIDWDTESAAAGDKRKRPRVEMLADNFAGAVLMPLAALKEKLQEWRKETARPDAEDPQQVPPKDWFRTTAEFFQVSVQALKFRLMNAGLVLKKALEAADLDIAENLSGCAPFGRRLLDCFNRGIDRGFLSARKAATLLQTSVDELAGLMRAQGVEPSFSL